MFPEWVDQNEQPLPRTTQTEMTVLMAYNRSNIPQHGFVKIQCTYKGEWRYIKFYVVTSEGPIILGLPSLKDLKLITLHCAIQETKCVPVNSTMCTPVTPSNCTPINSAKDLIEVYLEQFHQISHFVREYHIVL